MKEEWEKAQKEVEEEERRYYEEVGNCQEECGFVSTVPLVCHLPLCLQCTLVVGVSDSFPQQVSLQSLEREPHHTGSDRPQEPSTMWAVGGTD